MTDSKPDAKLRLPPDCLDVTAQNPWTGFALIGAEAFRKLRPPAGFRDVTLQESGKMYALIGAEAFRKKTPEE
jgi:hypothetical protein